MDSGDLSSDLTMGLLAPASSVRAVDGHSPQRDADGKRRRRPQSERENDDTDGSSPEAGIPAHQLDSLA